MAENETPVDAPVSLPDGHIDHNNEKIVWEYDEDGNFIGWHKEPVA